MSLTVIEALLHCEVVDIDPRRLLTLRAVSLHGGVQGAAAALHISPSAVSQQLAALEHSVGVALIDRSARVVRLTATGASLLESAAKIGSALDDAAAVLGDRRHDVGGIVHVSSFQSAIVTLFAPALALIADRHPNLDVKLREVPDSSVRRLVRSGELDLGTLEVRSSADLGAGLAEVPVLDDPWVVLVPPAWRTRSVRQLTTVSWISTFDDARADALGQLGTELAFVPKVVHRCVEYPSVLALVAAGLGAAVVPSLALEVVGLTRSRPSAAVRRLPAPQLGVRTITVVHRLTRHEPSPAVRAVIDAVIEVAQGRREPLN
jgi:DNA-binding transcriptional LysR family regulator